MIKTFEVFKAKFKEVLVNALDILKKTNFFGKFKEALSLKAISTPGSGSAQSFVVRKKNAFNAPSKLSPLKRAVEGFKTYKVMLKQQGQELTPKALEL